MGQKLTGLNESLAAIPAKTLAFTSALGMGGVAADATTRAAPVTDWILFHIGGHYVTFPHIAMLIGAIGGLLAILKFVVGALARLYGAAAKVRRRDRGG